MHPQVLTDPNKTVTAPRLQVTIDDLPETFKIIWAPMDCDAVGKASLKRSTTECARISISCMEVT